MVVSKVGRIGMEPDVKKCHILEMAPWIFSYDFSSLGLFSRYFSIFFLSSLFISLPQVSNNLHFKQWMKITWKVFDPNVLLCDTLRKCPEFKTDFFLEDVSSTLFANVNIKRFWPVLLLLRPRRPLFDGRAASKNGLQSIREREREKDFWNRQKIKGKISGNYITCWRHLFHLIKLILNECFHVTKSMIMGRLLTFKMEEISLLSF